MTALAQLFRRFAALALVACVLATMVGAAERIPPAPKGFVTDETHTLSSAAVSRLNARLEQYERESSNQILVAMFARMETDSSVEDYTVRVAESWHVGQKGKNNGAVLFVFKQDRQIYIQVGYGLEPTLTDATSHQIVENILKPRFRAGDFDGGVTAAVDAMIAATRGEFNGTGRTVRDAHRSSPNAAGVFFFIVMLIALSFVLRRFRSAPFIIGGPRRRGPGTFWDNSGSGGTWGGWSSGGGGWSGSDGGGGGFSGGGGSFGGGGAGGKW